eukprot:Unigene1035_Nuclearia_a/m.3296 Unigene1035_Nuclearia_a/g.3296  ORF Unigene1035_Nuclearia_a/g.3296 Unigene1035_Nuclearia_a/m.3296 type:complete len:323 (+) Unigene1035_Nuclearia_a:2679-3647(+)
MAKTESATLTTPLPMLCTSLARAACGMAMNRLESTCCCSASFLTAVRYESSLSMLGSLTLSSLERAKSSVCRALVHSFWPGAAAEHSDSSLLIESATPLAATVSRFFRLVPFGSALNALDAWSRRVMAVNVSLTYVAISFCILGSPDCDDRTRPALTMLLNATSSCSAAVLSCCGVPLAALTRLLDATVTAAAVVLSLFCADTNVSPGCLAVGSPMRTTFFCMLAITRVTSRWPGRQSTSCAMALLTSVATVASLLWLSWSCGFSSAARATRMSLSERSMTSVAVSSAWSCSSRSDDVAATPRTALPRLCSACAVSRAATPV